MDKHNHPSFPVVQPQTARHGEIDPVCGMTVAAAVDAERVVHEGVTVVFCSVHCRERFEAEPERYGGLRAP